VNSAAAECGLKRRRGGVPSGNKIASLELLVPDGAQPVAERGDQLRGGGPFVGAGQRADVLAGEGMGFVEQVVDVGQGFVGRIEHVGGVGDVGVELRLLVEELAQLQDPIGERNLTYVF
jgi:hypothetical protein